MDARSFPKYLAGKTFLSRLLAGRPLDLTTPQPPLKGLGFSADSPEYHVLRVLGDGAISADKARELLWAIQAGENPGLPFKIAPSPGEGR